MNTDLSTGAKLYTLLLLALFSAVVTPRVQRSGQGGKAVEDSSGPACTYYISPSGSDEKPGTLAEPWKTVQKADRKSTRLNSSHPSISYAVFCLKKKKKKKK